MQQTTKYKLNLIETSDAFSPAALNENTQKLEDALIAYQAGETTARQEALDALDQRLQVIEARKLVCGTYSGDGTSSKVINLGFTPKLVFASNRTGHPSPITGLCVYNHTMYDNSSGGVSMKIVSGGFQVGFTNSTCLNQSGCSYVYCAIT